MKITFIKRINQKYESDSDIIDAGYAGGGDTTAHKYSMAVIKFQL